MSGLGGRGSRRSARRVSSATRTATEGTATEGSLSVTRTGQFGGLLWGVCVVMVMGGGCYGAGSAIWGGAVMRRIQLYGVRTGQLVRGGGLNTFPGEHFQNIFKDYPFDYTKYARGRGHHHVVRTHTHNRNRLRQ